MELLMSFNILRAKFIYFIFSIFLLTYLLACATPKNTKSQTRYQHQSHQQEQVKKCNIDIECGVQAKCIAGVCTGGIAPKIKGKCVSGNFGKKVCSNSGKSCNVDSQCLGP